jgi:NAD(P)-dependent dehydrogenase (short-subunit alcohol dehydrogenase family)/putative sterol carrier protein/acyl dehydratase
LYALGVGAGFEELEFCYENRLKVLPSFAIGSIFDFLASVGLSSNANLAGILHGEQDILFHNPIPTEGALTTEGQITHMFDQGPKKGALVRAEADTMHSNGQRLFTNIFTLYCRLDGGFDGEPAPKEVFEFPQRAPDFEEQALPPVQQPLLYRLSGDIFALHVDPDFARAGGFEKPIMHGLCTHGYACRAVIKQLFPGQPERMTRFRARFSKALYPGVPIKTQIWKIEEGKALFRTINAETGDVVIDRGIVEWMGREALGRAKQDSFIRFDGEVAIVTGGGAGLGRSYALELAKRGAKVVVNDLGGARDGSGAGSASAADRVVEEIRALGGEAVASHDSVATAEGGEAIVRKAVETFGRVDIVINNAGILRDRSLLKMAPEDWHGVLSVHLNGAYNVTRPAFAKMREQGYGRVVMTTSAAGLFGNFGQANYGAAKMGLVGLMNTLKLEGEKYGVKVNTVAPIAGTRLTEDVIPPEIFERLKPEFVTPIVLYLCSRQCPVSGEIYDAGAGHYGRVAVMAGRGTNIGDGTAVPTPEEVREHMEAISSMDGAKTYYNATVALTPMLEGGGGGDDAGTRGGGDAETRGQGETVKGVFERMPAAFRADKAAGVDVVFQYRISGPGGGEWHTVVKDGACDVKEGVHGKPTTTISMSSEDFLNMMGGRLNAMAAFTSGKLKIEGDLMKSQLIEKLFKF